MRCDELKPLMCAHEPNVRPMYDKFEVDTAIEELKARIADLEKLNHDLCERVTENDDIRLHWEEIEQTRAENKRLKQKLENVQASMYCDVVDANMENRKLKRALWRAIALFCARSCEYFNGIMSHCLMGQEDLYNRCEKKKNKYLHTMYKCRAKAEEYK